MTCKEEVIRLFQSGHTLDYGDIADRLEIDLSLIVELCDELEKEGFIAACEVYEQGRRGGNTLC